MAVSEPELRQMQAETVDATGADVVLVICEGVLHAFGYGATLLTQLFGGATGSPDRYQAPVADLERVRAGLTAKGYSLATATIGAVVV